MHQVRHIRPGKALGAIAASLLTHVLAIAVLATLLPCEGDSVPEPDAEFGVVALVPVTELPEPEPDEPEPPQLHVALPEAPDDTRPEDATTVDRVNRTVERETVARGPNPSLATARPTSPEAARRGSRDGDGDRTIGDVPSRTDGVPQDPTPGEQSPDAAGADVVPTDLSAGEDPSSGEGVPEAPSPRGDGLDLTVFNPSFGDPLMVPGGDPSEHLELEEGDRTLVNSERSLYWSFFERMRRQVATEWSPAEVYRRHDPSGQRYRRIDRYTVLDITLGPDGDLREAVVQRASGLDFLDDEAIRAMRAAAPFPNVPEGLKDERGLVELRFGFHLTFDGRSRVRRIPL